MGTFFFSFSKFFVWEEKERKQMRGDKNSFFLLFIGIVALGLMGLNWRFGDESAQSRVLSETNHQLTIMMQEKDSEIQRLRDR